MTIRCSTHHRPIRAASLGLRGPEDAIGVILALLERPFVEQTVALVLDRSHRGLLAPVVDGAGSADRVLEVVRFVAAVGGRRAAAVVLGTGRPDGDHLGTAADHAAWQEMQVVGADVGLEVIDWFLVTDPLIGSMAELTDSPSRWRG